jgi:hypothetical protein
MKMPLNLYKLNFNRSVGFQSVGEIVKSDSYFVRAEEVGLAEVVEVEPVDSGDWDIIRFNQSGERPGWFQQTQPIRQYRDVRTSQDLTN